MQKAEHALRHVTPPPTALHPAVKMAERRALPHGVMATVPFGRVKTYGVTPEVFRTAATISPA